MNHQNDIIKTHEKQLMAAADTVLERDGDGFIAAFVGLLVSFGTGVPIAGHVVGKAVSLCLFPFANSAYHRMERALQEVAEEQSREKQQAVLAKKIADLVAEMETHKEGPGSFFEIFAQDSDMFVNQAIVEGDESTLILTKNLKPIELKIAIAELKVKKGSMLS